MLTMTHRTGLLKTETRSFLSGMEMFKNVSTILLAGLETQAREKKFNKRESIFLEGDPADSVWLVKEGHVKEVIHSASGRDMILSMVGAGGLFGTSAFSEPEYHCHAIAETDTKVVCFPLRDFIGFMEKCPGVGKAVIMRLSKLLRQSKEMQTFDQESVEKRILHVLTNLVEEFGDTIPLTRKEIADMVGTTVESSIRTFIRLERDKLVATERGKIIVKRVQDLIDRMEDL